MTSTNWGLVALSGLAIVVLGNALRARRTGDAGCLGHVFVASNQMTLLELLLNRAGMAIFVLSVIAALLV